MVVVDLTDVHGSMGHIPREWEMVGIMFDDEESHPQRAEYSRSSRRSCVDLNFKYVPTA